MQTNQVSWVDLGLFSDCADNENKTHIIETVNDED